MMNSGTLERDYHHIIISLYICLYPDKHPVLPPEKTHVSPSIINQSVRSAQLNDRLLVSLFQEVLALGDIWTRERACDDTNDDKQQRRRWRRSRRHQRHTTTTAFNQSSPVFKIPVPKNHQILTYPCSFPIFLPFFLFPCIFEVSSVLFS